MRAKANEAKLLKKCLEGDATAFEVIVAEYQELICAITYSGVADIHRSEDLAHQTFVNAWTKLSQLKDLSKFRPWLCTIARNHVKSFIREAKRDILQKAKPMEHVNGTAATGSGPLESVTKKEHIELVDAAIRQMPEKYREPLVLFYRQGQSVKQVARSLDLSQGAVKQRLWRGREMMKDQLSSVVEETLSATGPKRAFTAAVTASIAGLALKGSATATAAAGMAAATSTAGTSASVAAIMGGMTAKIIAAAALVAIGIGAVVVHKQINKAGQTSTGLPTAMAVEKEDDAKTQDKAIKKATEQTVEIGMPDEPIGLAASVVVAASPSQIEEVKPLLILAEPALAENDKYEFKPKGVLSGLITDIETGAPVTDATVNITAGAWHTTETDKNGFYCFDEIKVGGNYGIAVHSNEYIGISVTNDQPVVNLNKDSQAVKHFKLAKACMVDLWVVDEEGKCIKDEYVVATDPSSNSPREINRTGSRKETDENGYILLGGFMPAETEYLIATWHKVETKTRLEDGTIHRESKYDYSFGNAFVKLTDPDVIESVKIVLKKGMKVKGYAQYADGVAASDIKVLAKPDWWHCNYGVDGYPVDEGGSFELEYIVPGTYNISAYTANEDGSGGSSYVVMQSELPLPRGEELFVTVPEKSPGSLVSLSGTLTYVGEKKPRYVRVDAYSPIHRHRSTGVGYENGEPKNNYILDRLEPGKYRVTFSGGNIEKVVLENVEVPNDGLDVELVYAGKPMIECMAVDLGTGKALQEFKVRAKKVQVLRGSNYSQEDKWYYSSNEDGKFEIEVVGPGKYQIQFAAEGYAPKWSSVISTDKAETAVVELSKGGTISGIVIDEKGEAISGAKVMALSTSGGNSMSTQDRFINQQEAVETVKGDFVLENLPEGMETLKVVHPDYVFETIEDVEVVEGKITGDIRIALSKGATVEGYVYDADGKGEEEVMLFFQDSDGYGGGYEEEDDGRYGIATTDSRGFYSVSRLPEKLCYVQRKDHWNALGVVKRAIIPKSDRITRLNLGGEPVLTGTAIIEGVSLSDVKVQLGCVESPNFGHYVCNSRTDFDGNFIFRGVIEGNYAIYYENPAKRSDWIKLSNVEIHTEDIDVGVIPGDMSELTLIIADGNSDENRLISRVYFSDAEKIWGQPISIAKRGEQGGLWVMKGVEPGDYLLNIHVPNNIQIRQRISLSEDANEWLIKVDLPKSTSSVNGTILGDAGLGLALWQKDASIISTVRPDDNGAYRTENLPAGRYMIGSSMDLLNGTAGIAEFELHDGEDLTFDIDLSRNEPDKMAYHVVMVMDEQGKPRADIDIQLKGDSGTVEPLQSVQARHIFVTLPGEYVIWVQEAGYKTIEKQVKLKAIEIGTAKPKTTILNLERE